MIERKFVKEQLKEFRIQEFITQSLENVGHSHTKVQRTPLGEKIIIYASRPGLVVGRKGENIKKLTGALKKKFELENPQIEISEVESIFLDAQIVAEMIASTLERFGPQKFKGVGHKMIADIMNSGALGVEITISGKIPGARAKRWRFFQGYMKKCGDLTKDVKKAYAVARLKSGVVGINVMIMPPEIILPDKITMKDGSEEEEKKEEAKAEEKAGEKKPAAKKARKKRAKKTDSKKDLKKEDKKEENKEEAKEEKPSEEAKEEPKEDKEDKKEEPKADEEKK